MDGTDSPAPPVAVTIAETGISNESASSTTVPPDPAPAVRLREEAPLAATVPKIVMFAADSTTRPPPAPPPKPPPLPYVLFQSLQG